MTFPIFAYVAVLLLAALLSTRLMKILKLPNVTGYIITGIIVGPFVFGLLFNNFTYDGIKEGAHLRRRQSFVPQELPPGTAWQ